MSDCTSLAAPEQQVDSLAALAQRINEAHHEAETALNTGLQHALEAGRLLLEAKRQVGHGQWLPWLQENFQGKPRTARSYMLAAQRWPKIEAKWQRAANLSLRQVARLTAEKSRPRDKIKLSQEQHQVDGGDYFDSLSVDEVFAASLPELSQDVVLSGFDSERTDYYVEIYPSRAHPGYWHLVMYQDLDTDNGSYVYDRRPGCYNRGHLLAYVLESFHGVKPTCWSSRPAENEDPWFVKAKEKPAQPYRYQGRPSVKAATLEGDNDE